MQGFLSPQSTEGIEEPELLLKHEDELPLPLHKRKMASWHELFLLGTHWDTIGKATVVRADEVDDRDVADIFPVLKSGGPWPEPGVDRQILDRRRRNARERRCITCSRIMPNAALLCDIDIPAGHMLWFSADDLRHFYQVIPGTEARARSTQLGDVFRVGDFAGWDCFRPKPAAHAEVYIAWCGLARGEHNEVDWAQEMHINLIHRFGLLQARHWLIYPRCILCNEENYFEGVMIDDRVGL